MKMTQNYQIILLHYIYFFLGIFISSSVYLFLPHFIYFFLTIFISSSLYLLTYLSSAEMKLQRKLLTPFKSTEARVVGGRKVVERRGLSNEHQNRNNSKEIVFSSPFKLQTHAPLHTVHDKNLFWSFQWHPQDNFIQGVFFFTGPPLKKTKSKIVLEHPD